MGIWKRYKEKNGVTPLDLLNPKGKMLSRDKALVRMDICKQCPLLINGLNQCTSCGCFMDIKTKMHDAKCPIGKW